MISFYELAVYNLGGSNLLNFTQDAVDAPIYKDELPYFAYYRKKWNLDSPISVRGWAIIFVSTSGGKVTAPAPSLAASMT